MEQFELYLFCYEGEGMKQKPTGCNRDCQTVCSISYQKEAQDRVRRWVAPGVMGAMQKWLIDETSIYTAIRNPVRDCDLPHFFQYQ